jgi:two-component sensor histidine kinase
LREACPQVESHFVIAEMTSTRIDFETAFRALPSPYMILDRALCYIEVNAAYCAVVERRREDLVGRYIFDLFPNAGPAGRRLRESFERVLSTGQTDSIPLIPYPIERPASRGGGFEMRYWSAVHVPLFDSDGRVTHVMQNTVDVTDLQRLKELAYGPGSEASPPAPGEKDILLRAREVEAVNQSLLRESQGLRDLFMQAPGFMAVVAGTEQRFALVNNAFLQLIGHRPVIGKTVGEALPEVVNQGFVDLLAEVMRTGEPYVAEGLGVRLQRAPGLPLEERFLNFIYQPILGPDGEAWGVFVEGSDVTERVRAQEQQKLLVDELNHRVKNTLATVQAIAHQTLRTTSDPVAFRGAFEARLMALSATHDLLTAAGWRSASLRDVLLREVKPHGAERYSLDGPDVPLAPSQAVALGLLIHELATNAAKYGALSSGAGRVAVAWTFEAGVLNLTWTETGGPAVSPPTRRGFGSRLIERSLESGLGGKADLDYRREGVVCAVRLPLLPAD